MRCLEQIHCAWGLGVGLVGGGEPTDVAEGWGVPSRLGSAAQPPGEPWPVSSSSQLEVRFPICKMKPTASATPTSKGCQVDQVRLENSLEVEKERVCVSRGFVISTMTVLAGVDT